MNTVKSAIRVRSWWARAGRYPLPYSCTGASNDRAMNPRRSTNRSRRSLRSGSGHGCASSRRPPAAAAARSWSALARMASGPARRASEAWPAVAISAWKSGFSSSAQSFRAARRGLTDHPVVGSSLPTSPLLAGLGCQTPWFPRVNDGTWPARLQFASGGWPRVTNRSSSDNGNSPYPRSRMDRRRGLPRRGAPSATGPTGRTTCLWGPAVREQLGLAQCLTGHSDPKGREALSRLASSARGVLQRVQSAMIPNEGWLPDPSGRHEFRHYDQNGPTAWVSDGGRVSEDPFASHEGQPASSDSDERATPPSGGGRPRHPRRGGSTESEGWHADPLGRFKFRWLTAGVPTRLVSDDNGQVAFDDPIETPRPR